MGASRNIDASESVPDFRHFCRYLSERSPLAMVAVEGPIHVVAYVNPAFSHLAGQPVERLVGRPFGEAVLEGEGNGCLALLDRVSRTGSPEILAEQEHHHTTPTWWSYAAWSFPAEGERPAGVLIQVTDSTQSALFRSQVTTMNEALVVSSVRQHELAEEAELLSARMQAAVRVRDHFLAALSHELRNPLAPLSAGLHLLKRAGTDPVAAESARAMMERQLKQMVRLVDDLLDTSRIKTGKLQIQKERVDLASVVRDAVEASRPLIDQEGHELTVTLPPGPVLLDADPTRLTQALLNLLNNAAKFSERGRHITLSARRDGDEIRVSVQDEGIGIPASHLPHVFDDFMQVDTEWQRAQGGLGLGLSLVKEFVGLHGGRVEVHSDGPGRGSEFVIRLPATTIEPPVVAGAAASRRSRRRVLVVDDNLDATASLAMILELDGHEVRTAHDGEAGVAAAALFQPEVILMDLGMPKVDGYEAARRIRAEPWGSAPLLVALTGWGSDDDRRRAVAAGFDQHIAKPVDPDALARLIDEVQTPLTEGRF